MRRLVTLRDLSTPMPMPQEIEGVTYLGTHELAEEIGVSRQTIWRWRREGEIPTGNRFQGGQVLFSPSEVTAIRDFAFGVESASGTEDKGSLTLFGGGNRFEGPGERTDSEIYLDNNATTTPLPEVVDAMAACYQMGPVNASSAHRAGAQARRKLEEAREQAAEALGALPTQMVFTSGATEANHLVLRNLLAGSMKGFRLVTTAVEHSSILEAARQLQDWGVRVRILSVDRDGLIDLEELQGAIHPERTLVSVQWANNETGVVQPLESIAQMCQARGAVLHSDAVQAVGKLPVDLSRIPVDFLSLSGHKLHGPVGSGVLFRRDSGALKPVLPGGGQESGLRPGTENLPAAVGLAVALEHRSERLRPIMAHFDVLRHRFETGLKEAGLVETINGGHAPRIPNTSSITFNGVDGEALVLRLDQEGVLCSQSSACTNRKPEPSYVLRAMGLSEEEAFRSVRFSFCEFNTQDEVDQALDKLKRLHSILSPFYVPAPTVMT